MEILTQILTVPGRGGIFVLSVITVWVFFLAGLVGWVIKAPRDGDWQRSR